MDNNGPSFREGAYIFLAMLAFAAIMICGMALQALAANLLYITLAFFGGSCLLVVTVTKCYTMVIEARKPNYILEDRRRDYIKAGCREVDRPRGLLRRGR